MLRPDTFALTALLAALTALGPLSTDLYLPSLPDIGRAFDVSPGHVQWTLSAYLIGFAIGQIGYGPISDRQGRRSGMLVALACYCIGSLGCMLAPTIDVLIGARIVQAFGGSGAIVLARAIVRDLYSGARAGKELSLMGLVMAFGPVSAPLIGGVLHTLFGWRSAFAALLLFGLALGVLVWRKLPETLGARSPEQLSFASMGRVYRHMLRNRTFVIYLGIGSAAYAGLFAWLPAAPFVLRNLYGLSPIGFSIIFTFGALGFLTGTIIATRIVLRIGIERTIGIGAWLMVGGGVAMCLVLGTEVGTRGTGAAIVLVATMTLYLVGLGLVFPQAVAGGLSCFAERAGAASSLLGFVPQFGAAIVGALVVSAIGQTAWPVAAAVLAMALLTLLLWLALRVDKRSPAT